MSLYNTLYTAIWKDKKFKLLKEKHSRVLFIYFLSNESTNLCGIYATDHEDNCKWSGIKDETEYNLAFNELVSAELIMFDEEKEILYIPNRFFYLHTHSPKVIKSAIDEINKIRHQFVDLFLKKYNYMLTYYKIFLRDGHIDEALLYNPTQIEILKKVFGTYKTTKGFLMNLGGDPVKIDNIIQKIAGQQ